jgi:hypothetical protein
MSMGVEIVLIGKEVTLDPAYCLIDNTRIGSLHAMAGVLHRNVESNGLLNTMTLSG